MRIDHVGLYVGDLARARDFFVTYFGMTVNGGYHNERTGFRSYFLTLDDGARIELMQRPDMENMKKPPLRTGYAHVAIGLGSRERVNELTRTLAEAGYAVISDPRVTGDGYYESCVLDAEGNAIELME